MKYESESIAFYDWLMWNELPSQSISIFSALLQVRKRSQWSTEFTVANQQLQNLAGLSNRETLNQYRNVLIQKGLLNYRKGSGNQAGYYQLKEFCVNISDANADANTLTNLPQMPTQDPKLLAELEELRARDINNNNILNNINTILQQEKNKNDELLKMLELQNQRLQTLEEELLKEKEKSSAKKEKMPEYADFKQAYEDFYRNLNNAPVVIGAADGASLKRIIAYCRELAKEKNKTPLECWQLILRHWKKLEPFLFKQQKLTQINSNLANIVAQLHKPAGEGKPDNSKPQGYSIETTIQAGMEVADKLSYIDEQRRKHPERYECHPAKGWQLKREFIGIDDDAAA